MKKTDLVGGSPTTITDVPNPRGGTWSEDGTIVYAPDYQSGLFRVAADGKTPPVQLTWLDSTHHEGSHRWPHFLPDGKHVLYLVRAASDAGEAEGDAVYAVSLDGKTKKMLVQSSFNPSFAGGDLLFARASVLLAQKFDPVSLSLEGDPVKLQEGVLTDVSYNMAVYTVSTTGILLLQMGKAEAGARPMFVDRSGKILRLIDDRSEQDQPRFSRDGTGLALYLYDTRSRRSNIWTYDLRTGGRRRLTTRAEGDFLPCWSADGTRIFFSSGGPTERDIYQVQVAHGGSEKFFFNMSTQDVVLDCSPDGKTLLVGTNVASLDKGDLWLLSAAESGGKPVPFQHTKFNEHDGRISRDGKWVAYASDESGEDEIYLKRFDAPESDPWKISSGGGDHPVWGPGSNEVIYENPANTLIAASLRFSGATGEVVSVRPLFVAPPFSTAYDISPDGRTFVFTRSLEMQKFPPLSLIVNWKEALRNPAGVSP
jgi:Tol biopolymer transport system component